LPHCHNTRQRRNITLVDDNSDCGYYSRFCEESGQPIKRTGTALGMQAFSLWIVAVLWREEYAGGQEIWNAEIDCAQMDSAQTEREPPSDAAPKLFLCLRPIVHSSNLHFLLSLGPPLCCWTSSGAYPSASMDPPVSADPPVGGDPPVHRAGTAHAAVIEIVAAIALAAAVFRELFSLPLSASLPAPD
jgi:hypothetical protein